MQGATDLFVEEGVTRVALDLKVRADRAFAEEAAALVAVEHADQEVFAFVGAGIDDFAVLESKPRALHFAAVINGGEAEVDLTVDAVDHRAGEDFAVGKILVPIAVDP